MTKIKTDIHRSSHMFAYITIVAYSYLAIAIVAMTSLSHQSVSSLKYVHGFCALA